jgi:hypothetical protein
MRRRNVNKKKSARAYNKSAKRTAKANHMVARGGYRL